MSTALAKFDEKLLAVLDEVASHELVHVSIDVSKKFTTAFQFAMQINKISNVLTKDVMDVVVLPLKDKGTLGFTTDENRQGATPYHHEVIKCCVTEAILRGAQLVGNEFTIFQGKTFFTKPYFERKVRTFPGISNLDIQCSTPRMSTGGALVEVTATFDLKGKPQKIERIGTNAIAIRLQGSGGADMAIGKAEKRMYRFILNFITGYAPPADPDDDSESETNRLRVIEGVSVEGSEPVDDGAQAAAANPIQTPAPAASGVEAAKTAAKRTVKPKAAPATTTVTTTPTVQLPPPTPAPTPAAPVAEAAPAADAPVEEEEFVQEEPGSNDDGTEAAPAEPVITEITAKLLKMVVVSKNETSKTIKASMELSDKSALDLIIIGPEDRARSFANTAKANGMMIVAKYKVENNENVVTEFGAPPKK